MILHFVTWFPSKKNPIDGIFIRRHIELLAKDNTSNHIVVRKSENEISILSHFLSLLGFFKTETQQGLQVLELPQQSFLYRRFFWRFKDRLEKYQLRRLIKKYKPSINHLHVVYGFGNEAVYIKKRLEVPFIVSEHMGPFPFQWIADKERLIINPMKEADAVVAVSNAQAKEIKTFTGIQSQVIPNIIDSAEFHFLNFPQQNTNKGLQIVLVGIYNSGKGADYLIEAMPGFIKKNTGCTLHLVGAATDERMGFLMEQIESLRIKESVIFHGILDAKELCELYNQCDFYVCASEWESFGVSVLEALYSGLPVLSTRCGGVLEFVNEGNGLLIENDRKVETLVNGLLQISEQPKSFNRSAISEEVIEKFSGQKIKEQYYKIYNEVSGGAKI